MIETEVSPRREPGANEAVAIGPGDEGTALARQLRGRRAAADRMPPLPCGHRDPLDHDTDAAVTPHQLEAWRQTWLHLASLGYRVDVPDVVARAGEVWA